MPRFHLRPIATLAILSALLPLASAQVPSGTYTGVIDGKPARLVVSGPANALTGTYSEDGLDLRISGTGGPNGLRLNFVEPSLGVTLGELQATGTNDSFSGTFTASDLIGGQTVGARFSREGAQQTRSAATSAPAPTSSSLDPRLIGTWVNESMINSGGGAGGFASFTTIMTMTLSDTGRVVQTSRSVGGGGDWSSDSGEQVDFEGQWEARNGQLLVRGMGLAEFTPAASYSFSGDVLVTNGQEGRVLWQRR